jgi:hypothetical protein
MSRNKPSPPIEGFATTMSYGSLTLGYYEDGIVYLNVNNFSISTIIEEFAHYITGSDDCTRDFQDFAFELAGRLI